MKSKLILASVTALVVATANPAWAGGPGPGKILSRLPLVARQAIRAQLGNGRLVSLEKDTEDGELAYDVEMVRDGKDRDFTVGAAGELIDQQVFLPELSPVVQQSIQRQCGAGTLGDIYKSVDDGETSYDADVTVNGTPRDFTVGEDGSLLGREVFGPELSLAVRQMIQKQTGGGAPDEIDQTFDDDGTNYEVEITQSGQSRDFTVSAAGELIEQQMFLNELPPPVQAAIRAEGSNAKVGDIYKSIDDDDISYDVDFISGGIRRTVTFDPQGKVLSQERTVRLEAVPEPVQKAIASLATPGQIPQVSEIVEDRTVSYDVELSGAGGQKTVSITVDGKILPDDN